MQNVPPSPPPQQDIEELQSPRVRAAVKEAIAQAEREEQRARGERGVSHNIY